MYVCMYVYMYIYIYIYTGEYIQDKSDNYEINHYNKTKENTEQ